MIKTTHYDEIARTFPFPIAHTTLRCVPPFQLGHVLRMRSILLSSVSSSGWHPLEPQFKLEPRELEPSKLEPLTVEFLALPLHCWFLSGNTVRAHTPTPLFHGTEPHP